MSRLDEIQARVDAATPGPWEVDEDGDIQGRRRGMYADPELDPIVTCSAERVEDTALIAHAPADLAALVTFARAMEGLHRPHKVICLNPSHGSDCDAMVCDTCDTPWPCPTAKALDQIGGAS